MANANGTVTYTNNGDPATSDTFQYTIKDLAGTVSNAATVSITVNPAPLLGVDDTGSVVEDSATNTATGNVLTNDTGGVGTKTVSAVNGSAVGAGIPVIGMRGTCAPALLRKAGAFKTVSRITELLSYAADS